MTSWNSSLAALLSPIYPMTLCPEQAVDLSLSPEAGISVDTINAFRHAIIDGNPEDLVVPAADFTVTLPFDHSIDLSNTETTVTEGTAYSNTLTLNDTAYTGMVVAVTMGGTDITSTAYANGTITIPSVSGDIVITAWAYAAGKRISTSSGELRDQANRATTGYIDITAYIGKTIVISGWNFAGIEYCYYTADKASTGGNYFPREGGSNEFAAIPTRIQTGNVYLDIPSNLGSKKFIRASGNVSAADAPNLKIEAQ